MLALSFIIKKLFLFAIMKKYQDPKEKDGSFYVLKYIRTLIVPDVILKAIGSNLTSTYLNAQHIIATKEN